MAFCKKFNKCFVANARFVWRFCAFTKSSIRSHSAAAFINVDWEVATGLHILPGLRFNYDKKDVVYNRVASGGLDTVTYAGSTADKIALQGFKNGVYANQSYVADAEENNLTYQLTVAYRVNPSD